MKSILTLCTLAVLFLAAPSRCFALWSIAEVTQEEAKELDLEVRALSAGPEHVRIEMEFAIAGQLKAFDRVDLRMSEGLTAPLKEDRSNAGRVIVSFSIDRKDLDKINLWIMVPEVLGGTAYEVQMKRFVDLKKVK